MRPEILFKLGGAHANIALAKERLTTRKGYTFTQMEIDHINDLLTEANILIARTADIEAQTES